MNSSIRLGVLGTSLVLDGGDCMEKTQPGGGWDTVIGFEYTSVNCRDDVGFGIIMNVVFDLLNALEKLSDLFLD